jgi:hypothetical protein
MSLRSAMFWTCLQCLTVMQAASGRATARIRGIGWRWQCLWANGKLMARLTQIGALLLMASSFGLGQVTIKNPKHLEVPEDRVRVLFGTACRTVAEEFNIRDSSELETPFTLVLGEPYQHFQVDEENHVYTIYLDTWEETQFATYALRLAVQRMVPKERRKIMVLKILKRSNEISPVAANQLRDRR